MIAHNLTGKNSLLIEKYLVAMANYYVDKPEITNKDIILLKLIKKVLFNDQVSFPSSFEFPLQNSLTEVFNLANKDLSKHFYVPQN